ncbi:MAG TPA: MarC family protein, partial [Bryobacteraceae bacterium]|nr:MarC family protein [Bryobacteraceae bacterium]
MSGLGGEAISGLRQALVVFLALFPIVNPFGTAPLFLSMTPGYSSSSRSSLSRSVAINGFILLIV